MAANVTAAIVIDAGFIQTLKRFFPKFELKLPFAYPPGLLTKLSTGLDASLRASAARKAAAALETHTPQPKWVPEEEPPPPPESELIVEMEHAVAREEAVDVLYHVPGRPAPEYRHLTPLLVEQRGMRYYLIAYCHTRRADRTFRLDRLQLLDFPPA